MSPRRMDISSLLRDPSPPPRSADDLPASLLAILNSPRPSPTHHTPPDRPPFLGLDALVHVASEEHRRISAVSDRDIVDRPYLQDNARPHKRPRDSCPPSPPRSPSPQPTFPLVPAYPTSPSTRLHPSASPLTSNSYPTLRRQSVLHMEPTRVAPISPSLQHTSPFFPPHPSPRNNSPHRHSPQHHRSQLHSSPIQTGSFIPPSAEADIMSPRYGYGPRMAGGIQVLSNDLPRPDFSNYQSPRRDLERLVSESHAEHARHEPPKLSPLSARTFSLDDDRYQLIPPSFRVEGQEALSHRERRPPHLPLVDPTTDNARRMSIPAKEADFPARHPHERHPLRVWEEQPSPRDPSRRVSPARVPGIVSGLARGRTCSGTSESGFDERPAKDDEPTVLRRDGVPTFFISSFVHAVSPPIH
ncbi:hypothetical protein OG21DRAFT_64889 [Imleria badia]|nr:hypothetical protein OG21DRAFT_64889 [Imleria badia]